MENTNTTNRITRTIEKKNGNKWDYVETWQDPATVYDMLAHDLIAKKIEACTWITSIRRRQNYDGTKTITVNYSDNVRALYVVSDH